MSLPRSGFADFCHKTEAYLESNQTSKMNVSAKIVNSSKHSNISAKTSILDVWLVPEPAYVKVDENHPLNFFEGLIKISAIIKSFEDLNGQNSSSIWIYVARSHISFLDKLKLIFY